MLSRSQTWSHTWSQTWFPTCRKQVRAISTCRDTYLEPCRRPVQAIFHYAILIASRSATSSRGGRPRPKRFVLKERKGRVFIQRHFSTHALRHGSHSFTCKLHHACLSFVSVHQMPLSLTEVADIKLQRLLLIYRPRRGR